MTEHSVQIRIADWSEEQNSVKCRDKQLAAEMAEIHSAAFAGFALTALGKPFLEVFYLSFLRDPEAIVALAMEQPPGSSEGRVVGFSVGYRCRKRFYFRMLVRHHVRLAVTLFKPNLRIAGQILRQVPRALCGRVHKDERRSTGVELASLAVRPTHTKQGFGGMLVERFIATASDRNVDSMTVLTDAENNEKVLRFYARLGFHVESTHIQSQGRKMARLIRTLP